MNRNNFDAAVPVKVPLLIWAQPSPTIDAADEFVQGVPR